MQRVTRRGFLGGVVLVGAGALVGGVWWTRRDTSSASFEAFFSDPDGAARLGRAYLEAEPGDADHLLDGIAPSDQEPKEWLANATADEFGARVRAAVDEDWEAGRTTRVAGWYLAQSSARACAVLAQERGMAPAGGLSRPLPSN